MKTSFFASLAVLATMTVLSAQETRQLKPAELDDAFSKAATPAKPLSRGVRSRGVRKPGEAPPAAAPMESSRTYSRGARIITYSNGEKAEAPYAEIPILFVKGKADLLPDAATRSNVALLAEKVKEYGESGSRFVIEGHASAEGDGAINQKLSEDRANALVNLLTRKHSVPAHLILRTEGRGSRDAKASATASESQLEQDRKVLAVKEQ